MTGKCSRSHQGLFSCFLYYNVKAKDQYLVEILKILQEHPKDRKLILKLLRGKKNMQEALEGFGIKNILKEEG